MATQAGEMLQMATDPEAVSAELAASQAEALRLVAEAQGQLAAEQQARITAAEVAQLAQQAQALAEQRAETPEVRTAQAEEIAEQARRTAQEALAASEEAKRAQQVAVAWRDCSRAGSPSCTAPGRRGRGRQSPGRQHASDVERQAQQADARRQHDVAEAQELVKAAEDRSRTALAERDADLRGQGPGRRCPTSSRVGPSSGNRPGRRRRATTSRSPTDRRCAAPACRGCRGRTPRRRTGPPGRRGGHRRCRTTRCRRHASSRIGKSPRVQAEQRAVDSDFRTKFRWRNCSLSEDSTTGRFDVRNVPAARLPLVASGLTRGDPPCANA